MRRHQGTGWLGLGAFLLAAWMVLAACSAHAAGPAASSPGKPSPAQDGSATAESDPDGPARQVGATQRGKASWYGQRYHGRKTASGESFDSNGLSAAHRTLPFGTVVRVKNLDNDREVEVRINDRGPFRRKERVIDVSEAAARHLHMIRAGVVPIVLEVISLPPGAPARSP